MKSNNAKWRAVLVTALVTAVGVYLWAKESRNRALSAISPSAYIRVAESGVRSASTSKSMAPMQPSATLNYKRAFEQSKDYWDYAHKILPAARRGDVDAQYYLSKALEFCAGANKGYFEVGDRQIGLDEGLELASKRHQSIEIAQSVFDRCHKFQEQGHEELGDAADWLERATVGGQPVAQSAMANKMLMQQLLRSYATAGAAPTPDNMAPLVGQGAEPRELLLAAAQSGDPEALFNIGQAQALLYPSNPNKQTDYFAWMLVACERGLDCSSNADWIRLSCPSENCRTETGAELVRNAAGNEWSLVQQRAQEINAKIDGRQWNELGFGS